MSVCLCVCVNVCVQAYVLVMVCFATRSVPKIAENVWCAHKCVRAYMDEWCVRVCV